MANTDESNFPGYPHYPAKDDIMNTKSVERVDLDLENLSRSNTSPGLSATPVKSPETGTSDAALPFDDEPDNASEPGDSDITADDLIALGDESANFVTPDKPADMDLDIPGAEEDDANEEIGEEDEENNYYSLGGEAHGNLEEDRGTV